MSTGTSRSKIWSFSLLVLLIFSVGITKAAAPEVVVNSSVGQAEISRNTLRVIFGMRLHRWSNGTPIRVFVLSDNDPLHKTFSKKILNVFPHQLRRAWDRQVYSGTGQSPIEVASEKEMLEKVSTTPGAIGYLLAEKKDGNVKALQVR